MSVEYEPALRTADRLLAELAPIRPLSGLQLRILCYVAAHRDALGEGPTLAEIARYLDLRWQTTPQYHLQVLRAHGLVIWAPRKQRSLDITRAGRARLGLGGQ